ncbi:cocaine esterase-like [Ambystoma mexicanum]|uniref:cocaine esterase-like n=1 Tax=Ambystoma mexicanum TaxID=8296 RepID=UPI0037E8FB8C
MDSSSGALLFLTLLCTHCMAAPVTHGPDAQNPMVQSSDGRLEGLRMTVKGMDQAVNAYLGVPFAKPPVGSRRFSAPEPAEPWTGVRNATSFPPMCLQSVGLTAKINEILQVDFPPLPVSEDCLYLNIYTPAGANKTSKLPVMVWIHGGGLTTGTGSMVQGSALAAYEHVIVVCIQYRLGPLGFFSTGDEHARGNWGLLDQVAALQWVKRSIEDFGGDPTSVTIFGESAGAMSTAAHVLSPLSKGLFHKAISESGVLTYPDLVVSDREVLQGNAKILANVSGCETNDSPTIVECLKKIPEADFLKPEIYQRIQYFPVVMDGHFLRKTPELLLMGKEINPVPYLIGCNNHEFGWILPVLHGIPDLRNGMDNRTAEQCKGMWRLLGPLSEFRQLLIEEYLGDIQDPFKYRDNFLEFFGDAYFVVPSIMMARYHRDAGLPVYMYEFQHRRSMFRDSRPPYVKADHTDEIPFVFGVPFMDDDLVSYGNFTKDEETLSRKMMNAWANFARSGDPSGAALPKWPLYELAEEYLELSLEPKVSRKLKDRRVTFWTQNLPKKIEEIRKQRREA